MSVQCVMQCAVAVGIREFETVERISIMQVYFITICLYLFVRSFQIPQNQPFNQLAQLYSMPAQVAQPMRKISLANREKCDFLKSVNALKINYQPLCCILRQNSLLSDFGCSLMPATQVSKR